MLISGPKYQSYCHSVAKPFEQKGHIVDFVFRPPYRGRLASRIASYYAKLTNNDGKIEIDRRNSFLNKKTTNAYNAELVDKINETDPELLLIIKGERVRPSTIQKISKKYNCTTVLWCYDKGARFQNVVNGAKYYDYVFSFEPSDKNDFKQYDIDCKILPMAFDPNYYNTINIKEDIDISFIGRMHCEYRKEILEFLIKNLEEYNVQVWGKAWSLLNPFQLYEYKLSRRQLGNKINNYDIEHNTINRIYNRSKICLNIHHPQSVMGTNPRTFEIAGSGGFQLTDETEQIKSLFDVGEEIVTYQDKNDLLEKILYYIERKEEREQIGLNANEIAHNKHTFNHRVNTLLKNVHI
ncbi:CgeB family protein [Halorientalis persicus]|uniref:CgeB family protein n=1 Tax=Halorientalis persicus TaxID=1367881 RepID=UPI001B8D20DC|nr:glycosyltransferase [Halorientalis persicus]